MPTSASRARSETARFARRVGLHGLDDAGDDAGLDGADGRLLGEAGGDEGRGQRPRQSAPHPLVADQGRVAHRLGAERAEQADPGAGAVGTQIELGGQPVGAQADQGRDLLDQVVTVDPHPDDRAVGRPARHLGLPVGRAHRRLAVEREHVGATDVGFEHTAARDVDRPGTWMVRLHRYLRAPADPGQPDRAEVDRAQLRGPRGPAAHGQGMREVRPGDLVGEALHVAGRPG